MGKGKELQAIVEIAGAISPSLEKSINEAEKSLGGIDLKAAAVGTAVAAASAMVVKGVIEAGKALYNLGTAFEEAENTIRVGTGATGDALDDLMESFDEVYKSVPTSMEDASKAISDWNTRLGVSGDVLEGLSEQALQVSDLMGEDLTGTIEASSQAFKQWNIDADGMGGEMDYIFKVCQSTGMGFSDLMGHMQSSGAVLQDLGYNFDEAAAMIANLDKAGINTEQVLKGMKKGLGNIAKDGGDAVAAMNDYANAIAAAESESEAITIATEIFGSATAVTMAQAIRTGAMNVDELTASLQANGETINAAAEDTYTLAERFDLFKQRAQVAFEPLANTLLDSITELMPTIADLMEQIVPVIGELTTALTPIISNLIPTLGPLIAELVPPLVDMASSLATEVIPPIVEIVTNLAPILMQILGALMPIINTIVSTILPIAVNILSAMLPPIQELIMAVLPVVQELLDATAPLITEIFTALSPVITLIAELSGAFLPPLIGLIRELMPTITAVAQIITGALCGAFNILKPIIQGVISLISGMASTIASAFSGMVNIIKTPINAVISLVNRALNAINKVSVNVPDWVPGIGGKHIGFNINTIPMLASGGFTDGVSIAGEAGQEAVISFDRAFRGQNISYWAKAGQMLGLYGHDTESALAGRLLSLEDFSLGSLASEGQTIIYDMSGMNYNPIVNMQGEGSQDLMGTLRTHAEEFMDWMSAWTARKGRLQYA